MIACLGDVNEQKRWDAVYALGHIGQSAVAPLIACLRDPDSRMRRLAAEALGRIGDTRAVQPLIACLSDENSWMRGTAANALGRIGDVRAVQPLIPLLDDKAKPSPFSDRICDYAYDALQAIGTPEALQACADWVAAGNKPRQY